MPSSCIQVQMRQVFTVKAVTALELFIRYIPHRQTRCSGTTPVVRAHQFRRQSWRGGCRKSGTTCAIAGFRPRLARSARRIQMVPVHAAPVKIALMVLLALANDRSRGALRRHRRARLSAGIDRGLHLRRDVRRLGVVRERVTEISTPHVKGPAGGVYTQSFAPVRATTVLPYPRGRGILRASTTAKQALNQRPSPANL